MKKLKIAVLNHSTNIGNHFFELSIINDLKKIFKDDAEIIPVEGRHFYSNMVLTASKKNYLNYGIYTKCDFFVLSGPIFQYKTLRKNFEPLFKEMQKNGTKFIYLSAGSSHYTEEEIKDVRNFLNDFPPYAISTRDKYTYDAYQDMAKFTHNGICSAFFSSFHYEGYDTPSLGKYIILNFEEANEPDLSCLNLNKFTDSVFSEETIERCSKGGGINILKSLLKDFPDTYDKYKLVRTLHSFNPSISKPLIRRPNQFASVNAYAYLNLFSRSDLVLARRVHACVPALSYGKPAMLFNPTKRVKLFERLGLSDITKKPVLLPKEILRKEYNDFVSFLIDMKKDILNK